MLLYPFQPGQGSLCALQTASASLPVRLVEVSGADWKEYKKRLPSYI